MLTKDMEAMASELYDSNYLKPSPGRGVVAFGGQRMEQGAHRLLEVRFVTMALIFFHHPPRIPPPTALP